MTPYDPLWNAFALLAAALCGSLMTLALIGRRRS